VSWGKTWLEGWCSFFWAPLANHFFFFVCVLMWFNLIHKRLMMMVMKMNMMMMMMMMIMTMTMAMAMMMIDDDDDDDDDDEQLRKA